MVHRSRYRNVALLGLALALGAAASGGCSSSEPRAFARVVGSRADLVGGERALGEMGDYLLENDKIRVVVQKPGFSRGFGVYGGSLIDADLRRPQEQGTSGAGVGFDNFGELFPSFFVQAVAVSEVYVASDGSNGGPARVIASGEAGDFLELVAILNRAITGSNVDYQNPKSQPKLKYSTIYELYPDKKYTTIRFKVENKSSDVLTFPGDEAKRLLGLLNLPLEGFTVPIGDIALYGATSEVFIPGVGFDLRFGLEESYGRNIAWPAFPGFATEFIASRGDKTSYGLIVEESDDNYAYTKRAIYDDGRTPITRGSILVPFVASSFVGLFYQNAPPELQPGKSFEITKYFIVGSGDVGSVLDTIYEIRKTPTGKFGGQVLDSETGAPAAGTSVMVYQRSPTGNRRIFSQYDVRQDGYFGGDLEPGGYSLRIVGDGRELSRVVDFDVALDKTVGLRLEANSPARVQVRILDSEGQALPAKATAIGRYEGRFSGELTRKFLFDLQAGEKFRSSDFVVDDPNDEDTRRYIEAVAFTKDGVADLRLRPGTYDIVSSRGPEYDTQTTRVTVQAHQAASVSHALKRVVDTKGWIAADTHIHSKNSIDSPMSLDERVIALAAEGVEWAVSTDHNYITNFAPYIERNNLRQWLFPTVGLELTTLESGHFNGYPLRYDPGPITRGAFEWARRTPDQVFEGLRQLGSLGPNDTIVQVNHPRDQILGYYTQYSRNPLTADEMPPSVIGNLVSPSGPAFRDANGQSTFSFKYDAVELANGKLYWEIHHFRVPDKLPESGLPPEVPAAGTILRDKDGKVLFPGVVDDWFNLLNLGYRFVGVGTGDSHYGFDEAGQFRTMVYVGDDRVVSLTEPRIVEGLKSRHVLVTNGPLVDFSVEDAVKGVMGQTIRDAGDDGKVLLSYAITSAPWIGVSRLNIYRNGVIANTVSLEENRNYAASPLTAKIELPLATDAAGEPIDSWFVLEVVGYRSMFPVIRPAEIPPVVLTDAIASLAGPLGLANDAFGSLRPPEEFTVTAYAITNPVWVTRASGPFRAPGIVPLDVLDKPENDPKMPAIYQRSTVSAQVRSLKSKSEHSERVDVARRAVPLFYPRSDNPFDVRKVIGRLGHLSGGHAH